MSKGTGISDGSVIFTREKVPLSEGLSMHTLAFWIWLHRNLRQPGKALHWDHNPARAGCSGRS